MRADAFLAAAEALPVRSLRDLVPAGGIVVVAPHPDDESLGCGGLIAEACAQKIPVRLVVVSDGIGSHPNSKSHPPERLRNLRESETLAAAASLGLSPEHIAFLRLPDRFVPASGPEAEAAAGAIAEAARACGAGALFVTWAHDPHCDHAASAALARRARELLGRGFLGTVSLYAYPVWGWTLPPETEIGEEPRGARLAISHHLRAKAAAIAAHRSQTTDLIADDPQGFRLEPAMLARFARDHEIFLGDLPRRRSLGRLR
ncbi:PIG-L deacetylase family protein [Methylobacterium frigidaeris]|uniref:1D-myo-inositol 2-acetamido-2-deoxy-alpha-D-glucopyranoside deacetylase n=1 Tax=Methylobacterium frigidaeris TaxID=2038277 RepID=A0AA37M449_9HYPH|nr:PIG-L family deacetylase [Methylobacterium frigidaeris]PIK71244.1 PIG-L family deacetylase [Methylobacterium frigidaeris]GJD61990.1 1D-myo-inositol 2-acetamido-2-deoxy-alpha-D-glucopyranoside deacetylase [Methylobacterium frigidaeris]